MQLEIERKYLLRGMPVLPGDASAREMEQGYLPERGVVVEGDRMKRYRGRVRKSVGVDGVVTYTHTVKGGSGLVRTEVEREISQELFEALWAHTAGRRLRKTRYDVPAHDAHGLTWEVDCFKGFDLVLAEIELPTPETPVEIPAWLAAVMVREVTGEAAFGNFAIARRMMEEKGRLG